MLKSVLHINQDNSRMKSKVSKENQMIFGKKIINILKNTLAESTELIEKNQITDEEAVIFFMGNVPLLTLDVIKSNIRQYPDDIIFFKDERENPLGLYLDPKTLSKNMDVIQDDWVDFSALLTDISSPYRVEILKSTLCIFTKYDVHMVQKKIQRQINLKLVNEGVTFIDMISSYIDFEVEIGIDTIIYPNTFLTGKTIIGEDCVIGPDSRIDESIIGNKTTVKDSTVIKSTIKDSTNVGPYAYIRPNSVIGSHVKVGDFVEVKNATIGDYTKMSHLSYIGDADLGDHVNVGCGVVFVNYNGKDKNRSQIGDNSFIGCNSNIVAPVKVDAMAYVAAGTTVTKNVPTGALAVGRVKQDNKEGWVERKNLISKK